MPFDLFANEPFDFDGPARLAGAAGWVDGAGFPDLPVQTSRASFEALDLSSCGPNKMTGLNGAWLSEGFLDPEAARRLLAFCFSAGGERIGAANQVSKGALDGARKSGSLKSAGSDGGILRVSAVAPMAAGWLAERVSGIEELPPGFVGVNPLLRFVGYPEGCSLVGHYDPPMAYASRSRPGVRLGSLFTLVAYLSDAEGGATRMLRDWRADDFSCLKDEGADGDLAAAVEPRTGRAVVFAQGILHSGSKVEGSAPKAILTTELVFDLDAAGF